ncbi:MAG TPA: hypothetical protein VGR14_14250 [Verrucomicrobiae bacterium]|nr:hypothetical protein [Verrucomicrobiae bacterium]
MKSDCLGARLAPRCGRKGKSGDVFGETPNTATGTVALPRFASLRVHARLPRPADDFIIDHGNDSTLIPKKQKTYRRLFDTIFFGGSEPMLDAALQQLATRKILKNRQNTKANSFFLSQNIDLAAKTPQKWPVFLSVLIFRQAF